MLSREQKKKFDDLKRRVQDKRKQNPPAKTDIDAKIENQNAEQLMPYVYNRIAEVSL